jgi:hypothetical protein
VATEVEFNFLLCHDPIGKYDRYSKSKTIVSIAYFIPLTFSRYKFLSSSFVKTIIIGIAKEATKGGSMLDRGLK